MSCKPIQTLRESEGSRLKLNIVEKLHMKRIVMRETSLEREGGSKRRRSVFRELMVCSTALNTVRKDNSLRFELYGGFWGAVGSNL